MDPTIIVISLIAALSVAVFFIAKPFIAKQKKQKSILNADKEMKKFYYLLENSEATALHKLSVKNINDNPEYVFDKSTSVISFDTFDSRTDFTLSFLTINTYNYMVAECENPITDHSLPYTVNLFFARKINATPVESDYFEPLLKSNGAIIKTNL